VWCWRLQRARDRLGADRRAGGRVGEHDVEAALTFCVPPFCTVTLTVAGLPWVTEPGAVTLDTAISIAGGGGIGAFTFDRDGNRVVSSTCCRAAFCVAIRMWPVIAAPAVFQGTSTVVVAPIARPGADRLPTTAPPAVRPSTGPQRVS